jgi:DNA polymerase III epsilon subunit-like protein
MANLSTCRTVTFLDTETTHLDPSRGTILEITIITDHGGEKQDVWTTKIKPRPIELEFADPQALKVCNYKEEEWSSAPSFEEVAQDIVDKLQWGPIVGHNIQFDLSHIRACLKRHGYSESNRINSDSQPKKSFKIGYPAIDTCALAFIFLPTQRQNLNAVREHYNISLDRAHSAQTDAEDCRTVFYSIVEGHLNNCFSSE